MMATNLSRCRPGVGIEALNRLPGLAEPVLQIDLNENCSNSAKQTRGSGKLGGVRKRLRNTLISELF
jgi:hypothetical protein